MELEIINQKDQPLLQRTDIKYRANHPKEITPTRETVRDELAKLLQSKKENIVIAQQKTIFGKAVTVGYAKVYKNLETLKKFEQEHILVRNKLVEGKKKAAPKPKVEAEKKEKPKEPVAGKVE